jgi:branched-chain amino acid transport system permease protein
MYDLTTIVQFLVNGLAIGCIYGLVGIGFSVIFNASGIVNFAQGAFVMVGGILTYVLLNSAGLPFAIAALLAIVLTGAVGAAFELFVIRPLFRRRSPLFIMILATLALAVVTESAVLHLVGDQPMSFPAFTPGAPFRVLGVAIDRQILWIVGGSLVLVALLGVLYRYTLMGKAMRACAINPQVASLLAIPVERMLSYSFILSAALGAVGGILITPTQYTAYHISVPFSVSGFIAAILGGLGNPGGAFVGGIILGILQTLAVLFFDAGYKDIVAFSVLLVFLFLRPAGLFGSLVED